MIDFPSTDTFAHLFLLWAIVITPIILLYKKYHLKFLFWWRCLIYGMAWGSLSVILFTLLNVIYLTFHWSPPNILQYTIILPLTLAWRISPGWVLESYLLAILIGGLVGLSIGIIIKVLKYMRLNYNTEIKANRRR